MYEPVKPMIRIKGKKAPDPPAQNQRNGNSGDIKKRYGKRAYEHVLEQSAA
jgi:hypothetical protein